MHYENVSEKEPVSADEGASLKIIINTQYSIEKITTLNTKTTNNNKKKLLNLISTQQKIRSFLTSN
jgi:hypothetical protein